MITFVGHRRWTSFVAFGVGALVVLAICVSIDRPLLGVLFVPVTGIAVVIDGLSVELRVYPSHLTVRRLPWTAGGFELDLADVVDVEVRQSVPWLQRVIAHNYDRGNFAIRWDRCLVIRRRRGRRVVITVDDVEGAAEAIRNPPDAPPVRVDPARPDPRWHDS